MSVVPPAFQEAPRCDVCKCSFTTFRRRHHCRSCGRTLCHEHSSNYMALPQFGIYSTVRVCYDCFNNSSRPGKDYNETSSDTIGSATDTFARLNIGEDFDVKDEASSADPVGMTPDCKCGMPLCICATSTPDPAPLPLQNSSISRTQPIIRSKKAISNETTAESASKKIVSSSASKPSSFLNLGQTTNGVDEVRSEYDVSGEGLREAIKNSDIKGVKELLSKGVDASYRDKQGLTLLHLAALFNQTEIAFILMDHGASIESKNAQGETPLDCAPTMLQYKMRQKMQEGA